MSTSNHSKGEARPQYAPLPLPALQDERVSRRHLRALAVIAYHDRFGANGSGCYISQPVLATKAGIHENNVSRIIHDLEAWGYIAIERRSRTLRRAQFHVLYTTNASDDPWATPKSTPDGEVSDEGQTTRNGEVLHGQTQRVREVSGGKTSSDDEQKRFPEGKERYSPEGAAGAAPSPQDNPLGWLSMISRQIQTQPISDAGQEQLIGLYHSDDPQVRGMAERIMAEIDVPSSAPAVRRPPATGGGMAGTAQRTAERLRRSAAERGEGTGSLYRKDYATGTTATADLPPFLRVEDDQ